MNFFNLDVAENVPLLELADSNDWESISCSLRPGHRRAGKRKTPLSLNLKHRKMADFNTTLLSDIVVTDRVKIALTFSGLSGARFSKVKVEKSLLNPAPILWELTASGSRVHLSKESGVRLFYECKVCGLSVYTSYKHGLLIDEGTYTGADFFTSVEYWKHLLTSQNASQFITESDFTGFVLTPVSKVVWPSNIERTEKDAGNIYERRKLKSLQE